MSRDLRATYRVQLNAAFNFDAAAGIAEYLARLGVSHLYASPSLQAAPGSQHGYDVVDPRRANAELGGEAAHARLHEALEAHGLGQVLDIVPNHMAIGGRENAWWWDVLENGQVSQFAHYFDVDWDPPEAKLRNTVLLPILGDHYGRELEAGHITLARDGGAFTVRYGDHALPVAPRSLDTLVAAAAERAESDELTFLADAYSQLPLATSTDLASIERRHRDKEVLRAMVAGLSAREPRVAEALDGMLAETNTEIEALHALLERQNYRLSYWRTASSELGYRRFFDINSLIGIRSEDERVFGATHALVLRWLHQGVLDGVRIDHVDGLRDPETYLQRLRVRAPDAWIVVEKILEPGEVLPLAWPVAGTTGYDFLARVEGLFVDAEAEEALTALYADFTGEPADFAPLVRDKKLLVLRESLGSDVNRLTALWQDICQRHWRYRDYTRQELQRALVEAVASFPVYRSYVRAEAGEVREEDARVIRETIARARAARPDLDAGLFDLLSELLLLRVRGDLETEFVMRFQQLTGPAMAKGAEDTAYYCYNRLVSLNEVGGDPGHFGTSVVEFHQACAMAQDRWPQAMLATSTHDTKRSEDVRARISLLSEIPERWADVVRHWSAHNERYRSGEFPDRNIEYLFYQTLVGAWPIDAERATTYMEKAARESKQHTSWTDANVAYEDGLRAFIAGSMADGEFVGDVQAFVAGLTTPGWVGSLARTLLKLTAPGVPDLYQGTELWSLSLVDPDNRRPVDYALRLRLLREAEDAAPEEVWARRDEGLPKLWMIQRALALRARCSEVFGSRGSYAPLEVRGARAEHVVAFARGERVAAVVPRLVMRLDEDWGETVLQLPPGRWRNVLTGDWLPEGEALVAELLRRFPVALLAREDGDGDSR